MKANNDEILKVEGLRVYFPLTAGIMKTRIGYVRAVDGINFCVSRVKRLESSARAAAEKRRPARRY